MVAEHATRTSHHILRRISETHGWSQPSASNTRSALTRVLASYADGDRLTYSRLLSALRTPGGGYSVARTAEVLQEMGIFFDDRRDRLDLNLETKLSQVAPGIAAEIKQWVRGLVAGGSRRAPRSTQTALRYLHAVQPALLAWSQSYEHLRQVTRDDVLAWLEPLSGNPRQQALVAVRSLFSIAKKAGVTFHDPTSRIRVGATTASVLQPLLADHIQQTVAAATRPADPLIVTLATIHAARGHTIRRTQLSDVDLGNRRITLAGRIHPLDELTERALRAWLDYRRTTWRATPNPHLLINKRTAGTRATVDHAWLSKAFRGLPANLERLRMDRHLRNCQDLWVKIFRLRWVWCVRRVVR